MSKFRNILKAAKEREADKEVTAAQDSSAVEVDLEEDAVEQVAEPERERSPSASERTSHGGEFDSPTTGKTFAEATDANPVSPVSSEVYSQPSKRGRPKGKRSDPDYEQVTAYIKKETYRQTKIALLQQGEVQDFSLLVEKLLAEWLSTQNSKNLNS